MRRDSTRAPGPLAGWDEPSADLPINAIKDETVSFARALLDEPGVDSILRVTVDVANPG